jgi:hypothetical protein
MILAFQELMTFITQLYVHALGLLTLYLRNDVCTVRIDEMKLMYAMINRIRVSPVLCMIEYWLRTFRRGGDVECTSLITRLARNWRPWKNTIAELQEKCRLHGEGQERCTQYHHHV